MRAHSSAPNATTPARETFWKKLSNSSGQCSCSIEPTATPSQEDLQVVCGIEADAALSESQSEATAAAVAYLDLRLVVGRERGGGHGASTYGIGSRSAFK